MYVYYVEIYSDYVRLNKCLYLVFQVVFFKLYFFCSFNWKNNSSVRKYILRLILVNVNRILENGYIFYDIVFGDFFLVFL